MRATICLLAFCAPLLVAQTLPKIEGETLSGKKQMLPDPAETHRELLIIGFTHGSQAQCKAWSRRVGQQFPAWSVFVLEDVPRLMRGMVSHAIKGAIPKELYDRSLFVYHQEKELKLAAGFSQSDDAYLIVVDPSGAIEWRYHGPVSDTAFDQLGSAMK